MSTQVRLRRGTSAQHSTFTGAQAEVTVDTDTNTLVVHDGSTVGGFPTITSTGLNAAVSPKADTTYVDSELALKTDQTDFEDAIDDEWVDINISTLSSGILEIPDSGTHFNITGIGSSDYTITGFGTTRRAGWSFKIRFERSIANTGGTANSLGNKITFSHAVSGTGLDLTINKRVLSGVATFTYEAYPDACDQAGQAAALYEVFDFTPVGSGRHELRSLPSEVMGENSNGRFIRRADGTQTVTKLLTGNITTTAFGSVFRDATTFPAGSFAISFSATPNGSSLISNTNGWGGPFSVSTTGYTAVSVFTASAGSTSNVSVSLTAIGRWK